MTCTLVYLREKWVQSKEHAPFTDFLRERYQNFMAASYECYTL